MIGVVPSAGYGPRFGTLASGGLGPGTPSVFVVVPLAQSVDVVETIVEAGVEEAKVSVTRSELALDIAVIELDVLPNVMTASQISEVLSRSLSVEVKEIEMTVAAEEVQMTTEFTDIVQKVSVQEHGFDIAVIQVTDDTEFHEAIDKRDT